MKIRILLVVALVLISLSSSKLSFAKPKYGPEKSPRAVPLWQDREYFKTKESFNSDFWFLINYYIPQHNGYSCSAGTLVPVLNAALTTKYRDSDFQNLTIEKALSVIKAEGWGERLSKPGHKLKNGKTAHGVELAVFSKIVEAAFKEFGFPKVAVKTVHVDSTAKEVMTQLENDLKLNECNSRNFILANFNQKEFTDDAEVGHFAAVGAYDAAKKRVLILDPDREYYEPYWVSLETFAKGMATKDSSAQNFRGYIFVSF